MKRLLFLLGGFMAGVVNGLLGAGGGMVIVPLLKTRIDDKKAHATSVAIICSVCLVSAGMYLIGNKVTLSDAIPYMPFGVLGSLIGTWILSKIKPELMRKIFSAFMIWAGYRMMTK